MTTPAVADPRRVLDPPGVENPYWDDVKVLPDSRLSFNGTWMPDGIGFEFHTCRRTGDPTREELVHQYAWAITDPASVAFVAEHAGPGGIWEIAAGSGYWAWQLHQRGIKVTAYDEAPPDREENHWCQTRGDDGEYRRRPTFHPVLQGGADAAAYAVDGQALFLCWPPYSTPVAAEALRHYPGDTVIYIGEMDGGCCADEDFFSALAAGWDEAADHEPVQFGGIHDYITVHRRRAESKESTS